jgi:FecR protein
MKTFRGIHRISALTAALLLTALNLAAAPGKGTVKSVEGSATVDGKPAMAGDAVNPSSIITTGAGAKVVVDLAANGPDLIVLENSRVAVDELSADMAGSETVTSTKLNVTNGKIRAHVKKTSSQSSFIVKTPTTTAAVRGTDLEIGVDGTLYVWGGVVDVTWTDPATQKTVNFVVAQGQSFNPATGQVNNIPPGASNPFGRSPTGGQVEVVYKGNEAVLNAPFTPPIGSTIYISPVSGPLQIAVGTP